MLPHFLADWDTRVRSLQWIPPWFQSMFRGSVQGPLLFRKKKQQRRERKTSETSWSLIGWNVIALVLKPLQFTRFGCNNMQISKEIVSWIEIPYHNIFPGLLPAPGCWSLSDFVVIVVRLSSQQICRSHYPSLSTSFHLSCTEPPRNLLFTDQSVAAMSPEAGCRGFHPAESFQPPPVPGPLVDCLRGSLGMGKQKIQGFCQNPINIPLNRINNPIKHSRDII